MPKSEMLMENYARMFTKPPGWGLLSVWVCIGRLAPRTEGQRAPAGRVLEEGLAPHRCPPESPSPCPRPGGEWPHGALQLPWCSRPHLALTFLPAPSNLSGPSLIYQHPPAVLGTSLLRALAVPGGYCPEEPPAPALLAEVRDDSASDSDRGCFFFQNILHILCVSFTSEETGDQSNLLASLFFQSQEHTS